MTALSLEQRIVLALLYKPIGADKFKYTLLYFALVVLKRGERSEDSRIYECNKCGNLKALLAGEKAPACGICEEKGEKQSWKKTGRELLIKTRDIHKEFEKKSTIADKLSDYITAFCGNMYFVYLHIVWFSWWIISNLYSANPFDPFPFGLLTLVVSLEAILLATFILISQNRQGEISEMRSELDYQVDTKAEKNIQEILALQRDFYTKFSKKRR